MIQNDDQELNNALFEEIAKDVPDEHKIRELVAQGANISAVDSSDESVLIQAIWNFHFGMDIRFVKLLIDLGADVNHTVEGYNALYDAALTLKPDLVEMLLKAGANPNCISTEESESMLDWALFKLDHERMEERGGVEPMRLIIQLLQEYGAKSFVELTS